MFNGGRLSAADLAEAARVPGNDFCASQTNAAASLDLRIDPRLNGLIKCERRDCWSDSRRKITRRQTDEMECDAQTNEAARRAGEARQMFNYQS